MAQELQSRNSNAGSDYPFDADDFAAFARKWPKSLEFFGPGYRLRQRDFHSQLNTKTLSVAELR
jgi:hypothetical protein